MEYILRLAHEYEHRPKTCLLDTLLFQDGIEKAVQEFLQTWASTVPEHIKNLLQERIIRPIHIIKNRRLYLEYTWPNANEVCVKCPREGDPEVYISVSPTHVLIRDKEFGLREIALPAVWDEST